MTLRQHPAPKAAHLEGTARAPIAQHLLIAPCPSQPPPAAATAPCCLHSSPLLVPSGSGTITAGYQFPFLGISGIKITGKGKAAVILRDIPGTANYGDYYFFDYYGGETVGTDESINLGLSRGQSDLTFQRPGEAVAEAQSFRLEIFDGLTDNAWESLLPVTIDTSKSVVSTQTFPYQLAFLPLTSTSTAGFNNLAAEMLIKKPPFREVFLFCIFWIKIT